MKIALLLAPGFGLLAHANINEILFLLTRGQKTPDIEWWTVGVADEPVVSSSGREIRPERSIAEPGYFDLVIVISATSNCCDERIAAWLRDQAGHGATMGAVTSGTWLLAQAGLIRNRRCTIHWGDLEAFRECYPSINVNSDLFVIEKGLVTCSGGYAAADMMLAFFSEIIDREHLAAVAETLMLERVRRANEVQRMPIGMRLQTANRLVISAAKQIESRLSERNIVEKICSELQVSPRRLQALFKRHVGKTMKEFQTVCRLDRAKSLLTATNLSAAEIAVVVGFSDAAHLSRVFKAETNLSPLSYRRAMLSKKGEPMLPEDDAPLVPD
jgi:AraC family transcriptional regulator, glycine betaine-responsive activator